MMVLGWSKHRVWKCGINMTNEGGAVVDKGDAR